MFATTASKNIHYQYVLAPIKVALLLVVARMDLHDFLASRAFVGAFQGPRESALNRSWSGDLVCPAGVGWCH